MREKKNNKRSGFMVKKVELFYNRSLKSKKLKFKI